MFKCPVLKRGDLRDALVDYTMNEAREGRIETMSLRKAARDLGVSSGAVYRHFDDKDALFVEVVASGMDLMKEQFFAIRPEGDKAKSIQQCIDRLYRMNRVYINFAHDNPTLWQMMFGRIGKLCRDEFMTHPDYMRYTTLDVMTQTCDDLFELGGIPIKPDIRDHRFMWSAAHGAADLAQYGARQDSDQLDMVADQTTERSLRLIGYKPSQE